MRKNSNPIVFGGFKKWSIEYDRKGAQLIISGNRIPINITMELGDVSTNDINELAKMFTKLSLE